MFAFFVSRPGKLNLSPTGFTLVDALLWSDTRYFPIQKMLISRRVFSHLNAAFLSIFPTNIQFTAEFIKLINNIDI